AVVGIRTEQASTRCVKSQPTCLQHAPDTTHGVRGEPVHRRPNRAQGPAARRGATLGHRHFPPRSFTRSGVQYLYQFLPHGLDLLEVPSGGPHPVGGRPDPQRLPLHRLVTSYRACLGPAASARLAAPRHAGAPLPQSGARRCTARARRDGHHDCDSVPVPVVPASLVLTFVGWPSPFSCCMRWLYITDFGRQSSLEPPSAL